MQNKPSDSLKNITSKKSIMVLNQERDMYFKCKHIYAKSKIEGKHFKCKKIKKLNLGFKQKIKKK